MWSLFYASASRHCWTFSDIVRPLSDIGQCCYRHIVRERLARLLTSCHMSLSTRIVQFHWRSNRWGVFKAYPLLDHFINFLHPTVLSFESVGQNNISRSFVRFWILTDNSGWWQIIQMRESHRMAELEFDQRAGPYVVPRPSCELGNLTGPYVA